MRVVIIVNNDDDYTVRGDRRHTRSYRNVH